MLSAVQPNQLEGRNEAQASSAETEGERNKALMQRLFDEGFAKGICPLRTRWSRRIAKSTSTSARITEWTGGCQERDKGPAQDLSGLHIDH